MIRWNAFQNILYERGGAIDPFFVLRRKHPGYAGPLLDRQILLNRLLPAAQRFVARGDLAVELLLTFFSLDIEQFFLQEISEEGMQFIPFAAEAADQRKLLFVDLRRQKSGCGGSEELVGRLGIDFAQQADRK